MCRACALLALQASLMIVLVRGNLRGGGTAGGQRQQRGAGRANQAWQAGRRAFGRGPCHVTRCAALDALARGEHHVLMSWPALRAGGPARSPAPGRPQSVGRACSDRQRPSVHPSIHRQPRCLAPAGRRFAVASANGLEVFTARGRLLLWPSIPDDLFPTALHPHHHRLEHEHEHEQEPSLNVCLSTHPQPRLTFTAASHPQTLRPEQPSPRLHHHPVAGSWLVPGLFLACSWLVPGSRPPIVCPGPGLPLPVSPWSTPAPDGVDHRRPPAPSLSAAPPLSRIPTVGCTAQAYFVVFVVDQQTSPSPQPQPQPWAPKSSPLSTSRAKSSTL